MHVPVGQHYCRCRRRCRLRRRRCRCFLRRFWVGSQQAIAETTTAPDPDDAATVRAAGGSRVATAAAAAPAAAIPAASFAVAASAASMGAAAAAPRTRFLGIPLAPPVGLRNEIHHRGVPEQRRVQRHGHHHHGPHHACQDLQEAAALHGAPGCADDRCLCGGMRSCCCCCCSTDVSIYIRTRSPFTLVLPQSIVIAINYFQLSMSRSLDSNDHHDDEKII